jgi:hypothetical protein
MSTALLVVGGVSVMLGLLAFFGAWFGRLPRLDFPRGATEPEKLMIQLQIASAVSVELVLAVLLISFGVLFFAASRIV